jgi:hypothetical protein
MGLSNAERQARWRAMREALVRANPEVAERDAISARTKAALAGRRLDRSQD